MNIVLDTNILMSALIKDSTIRKIIINSPHNFILPEFELEEIYKHKKEILAKSKLSERELDILLLRLLRHIRIAPAGIVIKYKEEANKIMYKIDSNDVPFIATALAFNCPIWTEDKHFKRQNKVKILSIKDLLKAN